MSEARLERIERIIEFLADHQASLATSMENLTAKVDQLTGRVDQLSEKQTKTEEML